MSLKVVKRKVAKKLLKSSQTAIDFFKKSNFGEKIYDYF